MLLVAELLILTSMSAVVQITLLVAVALDLAFSCHAAQNA